MLTKYRVKREVLSIILGGILILISFSTASAEIMFSTDIPTFIDSESFEEKDMIYYDDPDFINDLSGSSLGLSNGVDIKAFGFSGAHKLFAVDIPTTINGSSYTCSDLIRFDGSNFNKIIDGAAIGIPDGACIDAATMAYDGSIIFSLDIPVDLNGITFEANDLIRWDDPSFSVYFDGSDNNIPEGVDVDGVYVFPSGRTLLSLDIPTEIDGLEVTDKDIIEWDQYVLTLYSDKLSTSLPVNTDVDSLALDVCESDFDCNGNVSADDVTSFIEHFGRNPFIRPCTNDDHCNGDFYCDVDVDADDIGTFLSDFGRNPYNKPCITCVGVDWCVYE